MSGPHYSIALEADENDWYAPECQCGWSSERCPTAEDACDVLMQHAYEQGILDGSSAAGKEPRQ